MITKSIRIIGTICLLINFLTHIDKREGIKNRNNNNIIFFTNTAVSDVRSFHHIQFD